MVKIFVFFASIFQKIVISWRYANCYVIAKGVDSINAEKGKCPGNVNHRNWRFKDHILGDLHCRKCPFYTGEDSQ